MQFISVRDLWLKSSEIWQQLKEEREIVVTSNGLPVAIISSTDGYDLDEYLTVLCRVRAMLAVKKMQGQSLQEGLDQCSIEEIEAEIKAVRKGCRI